MVVKINNYIKCQMANNLINKYHILKIIINKTILNNHIRLHSNNLIPINLLIRMVQMNKK